MDAHRAVDDVDVAVRRNDVDHARRQFLARRDCADLELCASRQDVAEVALSARIEMLRDDHWRAEASRQIADQLAERVDPAGGCADHDEPVQARFSHAASCNGKDGATLAHATRRADSSRKQAPAMHVDRQQGDSYWRDWSSWAGPPAPSRGPPRPPAKP